MFVLEGRGAAPKEMYFRPGLLENQHQYHHPPTHPTDAESAILQLQRSAVPPPLKTLVLVANHLSSPAMFATC